MNNVTLRSDSGFIGHKCNHFQTIGMVMNNVTLWRDGQSHSVAVGRPDNQQNRCRTGNVRSSGSRGSSLACGVMCFVSSSLFLFIRILWVHLNTEFRADLGWWQVFLPAWNRRCMMKSAPPEVIIFSDASGNWGCGAIWDTHWLQWEWDGSWI